jgi:hypothetical protein
VYRAPTEFLPAFAIHRLWRAQIIEKRRLGERSVASISILRDIVILIALFAALAVLIIWHPNLQVLIAGILLIGGLLLAVAYEWMDARKILVRLF